MAVNFDNEKIRISLTSTAISQNGFILSFTLLKSTPVWGETIRGEMLRRRGQVTTVSFTLDAHLVRFHSDSSIVVDDPFHCNKESHCTL